jgi:hypothetical protein
LKTFFGQSFKVQDWWKLVADDDKDEGEGGYRKRGKLRTGSQEKALLSCVGVGYFNISRRML